MGLNLAALELLEYARIKGVDFSKILTVGRQGIGVLPQDLKCFYHSLQRHDVVNRIPPIQIGDFCEDLLKQVYEAKIVDSVDKSNYEEASIIHDMNFPFNFPTQYSLVLDLGCLEHIYNFPVAIDNLINATQINGHIIHIVPTNNDSGHGFYQFSPELFFSLYSEERGFVDTELFLCELNHEDIWYRVRSPKEMQKRVCFINSHPTAVLVLTKKYRETSLSIQLPPQQSDYVEKWDPQDTESNHRCLTWQQLKEIVIKFKVYKLLSKILHRINLYKFHLHTPRADLKPFKIQKFLKNLIRTNNNLS